MKTREVPHDDDLGTDQDAIMPWVPPVTAKCLAPVPSSFIRVKRAEDFNTPPKFNIAPEKWWLEDEFPVGIAYF